MNQRIARKIDKRTSRAYAKYKKPSYTRSQVRQALHVLRGPGGRFHPSSQAYANGEPLPEPPPAEPWAQAALQLKGMVQWTVAVIPLRITRKGYRAYPWEKGPHVIDYVSPAWGAP
jgi:hypothetical protein